MRYLLPLLLLFGCAAVEVSEERQYNRQMDRENWALCEAVMERQGVMQAIHMHHHGRGGLRHWMVREDLFANYCRQRLGIYWANHI